ncbi:uncharacterized protein [Montipora capricornis]|uniref:uncharacterized protein isoform X1 n=2 Tax=Montipora capricornis TaxID=246305 RepID=UPI0035F11235
MYNKMLLRLISMLAVIPLFIQEVRTEAKIEKSRQYNQQHQPSSGSGEGAEFMSNPQIKGRIPKTDRSKGVYMHDHPDFPGVQGGPGEPYRTHYLHARFGIGGQRRKRSPGIEDTLLKIFNIRLPKEKEQT